MVGDGYVSSFVAGVHEVHDAFVAKISAEISSCTSRKGEGDRYQTMSLNVSMKHDSIYNGIYVSATVPSVVTCRRESPGKVPFLLPQISREMASFTGGNVGEKGICIDTPVIGTQQSSNRIAFKKKFFQYKRREKRCSPIFQIKIHFISNKYTLSTDFPVRSGHSGDHLRLYTANERV